MGDDESFWASHLGKIDRHRSRERRGFSLKKTCNDPFALGI